MSSNTGSGASVNSSSRLCVSVRQASAGRPLTSIAQLPQMPARQTKSNCSEGSCFSRIAADNALRLATWVSVIVPMKSSRRWQSRSWRRRPGVPCQAPLAPCGNGRGATARVACRTGIHSSVTWSFALAISAPWTYRS